MDQLSDQQVFKKRQQRKIDRRKVYQNANKAQKRLRDRRKRSGLIKRTHDKVASKSAEIKELKCSNTDMKEKIDRARADQKRITRLVDS